MTADDGKDFVRGTDNGTYWRGASLGLLSTNPFLYQEFLHDGPWGPTGMVPDNHRLFRAVIKFLMPSKATDAVRHEIMKVNAEEIVEITVNEWIARRKIMLSGISDLTRMVLDVIYLDGVAHDTIFQTRIMVNFATWCESMFDLCGP
tara:strand:+ start:1087 stop:1527 length:441 start_codon:yes stop_codon:yes gene_type:complete